MGGPQKNYFSFLFVRMRFKTGKMKLDEPRHRCSLRARTIPVVLHGCAVIGSLTGGAAGCITLRG